MRVAKLLLSTLVFVITASCGASQQSGEHELSTSKMCASMYFPTGDRASSAGLRRAAFNRCVLHGCSDGCLYLVKRRLVVPESDSSPCLVAVWHLVHAWSEERRHEFMTELYSEKVLEVYDRGAFSWCLVRRAFLQDLETVCVEGTYPLCAHLLSLEEQRAGG